MTAGQKFIGSVPEKSRLIVERALDGTASPRAAIKAMCLSCCGYDRAEIAACPTWRCPLQAYRPFQPGSSSGLAEGSDFQPSEGAEVSEPQSEAASARNARGSEVRP